jgi:hypothetical protein
LQSRPRGRDRQQEGVLQQGVYTFVFKVSPAHRSRLERLLEGWGPDGAEADALGFADLDTLHFASVTIFDREFLDALLVIECNFDGDLETFLQWFSQKAQGLADLLNCRIGPAVSAPGEIVETLRAAAVKPAARHIGALGLSRVEILASEAVVEEVRRHLDANQGLLSQAAAPAVAAALRQAFNGRLPPVSPRRSAAEAMGAATPLVLAVLGLLALAAFCLVKHTFAPLLALAALIAIGAVSFLSAERREPVRESPQARDDPGARNENRPGFAQNHFSSIAPLKTGPVRWASLRLFMWVLNAVARLFYTKGRLGRIPSIHFAHWSIVDDGSSLIFVSNYGGTWESYLDDFIQKAADGLTGVWSHCQGFPASRRLTKGGARDERAFKRYARDTQAVEAIWFSAYPRLTTSRINNNRAIVEALAGVSKEPPERWLARI